MIIGNQAPSDNKHSKTKKCREKSAKELFFSLISRNGHRCSAGLGIESH